MTSEAFVKSVTSISDNTAGRFILPSIREAQEEGLRNILGDALLGRLKELVRSGEIESAGVARYKDLLGRCQYYLAYSAVVEVTEKVTLKVGNFGVAKTTDENLQVADAAEVSRAKAYWQSKADACAMNLQTWLLDRRADFPELTSGECWRIGANLTSAASCGIWLGGPRGKCSGGYGR